MQSIQCIMLLLMTIGFTPSIRGLTASTPLLPTEPVKLARLDGSGTRNAVLQAFMPVVLDALHDHAQKKGRAALNDDQLCELLYGPITTAEGLAIALARTALQLNLNGSAEVPCQPTPFERIAIAASYGNDATSIRMLTLNLAQGINTITDQNMTYHQLPADREQVHNFSVERFLNNELSSYHSLPNYLILDTAAGNLRTLDKRSLITGAGLCGMHESSLPGQFTITRAEELSERYVVCSFISVERSGIPYDATLRSRIAAWFRKVGNGDNEVSGIERSHPVPSTTATVRYNNSWFVTDGGCIWKVCSPSGCSLDAQGTALLSYQPGHRAIVIYKKVTSTDVTPPTGPYEESTLELTKVEGPENLFIMEKPIFRAIVAAERLCTALISTAAFSLAWKYCGQWSSSHASFWTRAFLSVYGFAHLTIVPWGKTLDELQKCLLARKRLQKRLIIDKDLPHKSGLYS